MLYALVFSLVIIATILVSKVLERRSVLNSVISRKILHVVAISLSAVSVFYIDIEVLQAITSFCLPVLVFIVYKGFFRDPQTQRRSWGIVYFNFVFAALVFLFPKAPELVFYPLMILALGDGLATIVGVSTGRVKGKSLAGFLTFFFSSLAVFMLSPKFFPVPSLPFETVLILSLSLAAIEFITIKSLDNLSVPAAVVYWVCVDHLSQEFISLIFVGIVVGTWLVYKVHWLSRDGSILAGIIALVYLSSPLPQSLIPGFIFFAGGSILSKLPGSIDKENARTSMQVFSNGGPALLAICLFFVTDQKAWLLASIVSFSAALSDTTSSELGTRYSSRTFDILGKLKMQKGTSGGVSLAGFIFGISASVFLALTSSMFLALSLREIALISIFGLVGNIVDSILGSVLQSKTLESGTGLWVDEKAETGSKTAGISWFDNNLTNLTSISLVTILSYFIFLAC